MAKTAKWLVPGLLLAMVFGGCAGETDSLSAGLEVSDAETGVRGSFVDVTESELGVVDFRYEQVSDSVYELYLELNDMALVQLVDLDAGVVEYDGYALADAGDTHMAIEDRELLLALSHAIDLQTPEHGTPLARVRDFASHWSEFPIGMDMQYEGFMPAERGSASICYAVNKYISSTHDGWWEDNWDDDTTITWTYASMHGACRTDGGFDDNASNWSSGNGWSCPFSEPDHSTSIEYSYGDCFGRCGGGCGSGTVFSISCLDHDNCNRFGHSGSASIPGGHCGDEFAAAGLEIVSEPNCL